MEMNIIPIYITMQAFQLPIPFIQFHVPLVHIDGITVSGAKIGVNNQVIFPN